MRLLISHKFVGSNNARLSNLLRQLAVYHAKDAQTLMLVRIAQGLTHMGELRTLNALGQPMINQARVR
jgi:hypothetical protein